MNDLETAAATRSMTDAEREAHVLDCAQLMERAYEQGDLVEARIWMEMHNEAIKGRSSDFVHKLELERALA